MNPLKRDQALNDATNRQLGEQPRPKPLGRGESSESETDKLARCLEICDVNTNTNETGQYMPVHLIEMLIDILGVTIN